MSVLVYLESEDNKFKKSSYETLSYGKALADMMETDIFGVVFNCSNTDSLKNYGINKILKIDNPDFNDFSAKKFSVSGSLDFMRISLSKSLDTRFDTKHCVHERVEHCGPLLDVPREPAY